MDQALIQAKLAFDSGEVPVGAVIVDTKTNQIISQAYNQNITLNDVTAHAEILAIKKASKIKDTQRLEDCDLYVTLEPCAMCAAAISFARIRKVYFGAHDEKFGAISLGNKIFSEGSYFKTEFYGDISALESQKLLKDFFAKKRKKYD